MGRETMEVPSMETTQEMIDIESKLARKLLKKSFWVSLEVSTLVSIV